MARKNGNLVCLDLFALRQLKGREGSEKGIGRRTFLAGAAVAAVTSTGAGRAAAGALSLGALRIKRKTAKGGALRSVTIAVDTQHAWTLDTAHFDGTPTLTLEESANAVVLRLDAAKLPGTEFAVNLVATIHQGLLSRSVEFQFKSTGVEGRDFAMTADFDSWVRGQAHAATDFEARDLQAILGPRGGLNKGLDLEVKGKGSLEFLPNSGFRANGCMYELKHRERTLALGSIALVPGRNDGATALSQAGSVTRLSGEGKRAWKGAVRFQTDEGWIGSGSLKGFDRLEAELHSPEAAMVCLEGDGPFDLQAVSEEGVSLRLDRARYVSLTQPGHSTEALAAKIHDQGSWMDLPGVSLEIGPKDEEAEALFARIEDPEGASTFGDIQAGIRNASFKLDGAITRTRTNGIEPISLLSWSGQGTRPPVTIQRPPTTVTPTSGAIGQAGRLDLTAVPKFRLAPFQLEVVRKEDMLALTFEFVNLAFQGGGQAALVKADATKPSYIAVIFPPQSVAEAAYDEDVNGNPKPSANAGPTRRPIPSRLAGESRLVFWIPPSVPSISFSIKGDDGKGRNGLLDWKRWSPSITATAVSRYGTQRIRIDAAHVSPLDSVTIKTRNIAAAMGTVRPPDEPDAGLLASVRKLAARRGPSDQGGAATRPTGIATQPQVRVNATAQLGRVAQGIDPTITFRFIPKNRIEPNALHTQIEMPVRLIISPNETAGWAHSTVLPQNPPGNRYALWHTRLGNKVDGAAGQEDQILLYSDDGKTYYRQTSAGAEGPFPLGNRSGPTIRAIDAVDYGVSNMPPVIPDITSSGFHQLYHTYQLDRKELVDNMCWRGEGSADSEPFEVSNLILTSLGGYLKGEWVWRTPTGWNRQLPQLISWRHISTLGRDHYVKLVKRGFLFPTGHKAVMIETTERKFNVTTEGKVVAYLRRRKFVVVRDPLIQLNEAETRALGFSSLTCLTKETPILDPLVGGIVSAPWNIQQDQKLQWLYSGGTPVMFQMKGVDVEGKTHQWSMPSLFVYSNVNDTAEVSRVTNLIQVYNNADAGKKIPLGFPNRARLFGQNVAFAPGGGKTPSGEDSEGNTSFPVNDLLITAVRVGGDGPWMVDSARWRPVLFKANITAPAVQMMQGKPPSLGAIHMPGEMFDMEQLQASMNAEALMYAEDDGFDVKIPDVFKQSGLGSQNKSQMFLELVDKYAPKFGDTSKSGGIVNPNMLIQGLSKGKGPIGGDLNEILNGEIDPKKLMDSGARLLGAVKIFDILPNPIKIDPGGPESPYIEILMIYDDGKNKPPTGAKVAVIWKPPLQNWGFPNEPPLFYIKSFKSPNPGFSGAGELKLEGSIKTKFKGGSKPEMVFKGHITNFRVDLISPASFLLLDFRKIEFIAEVGKPFDVNIDLSKMTFVGPLTFIQKLQDLLNGGGQGMQVVSTDPNAYLVESIVNTEDPGIDVFFDVDETGIRCGLTITVPSVSVGMLAIRNISVGVKLNLPFFGDPLSVRFNFCERNNTFQISVMMVTGGGFVAMEINIDGQMIFEAAFEFGGSLSFDIGVASGGVSIMAGIYFRLEVKDDYKQCMVEAYIRLQGNLSVLGLIRISLEFYLSLTYYSDGNRLIGTATLTVEIEILFFSISVSLTVQRQIAGEKSGGSYFFASNDPDALPAADETTKFTEVVTQAQWVEYCNSFA